MQFRAALLSVFVAAAAAQNATDSSESLPDLVKQLPQCAMGCFQSTAKGINCEVTDFACLCGPKKQDFINKIGPCIFTAGCSSDDLNNAANLAPKICEEVNDNPSPSAVSSASALVASAVQETGSPDNAAGRPEIGYGLLGVAALAAAAL